MRILVIKHGALGDIIAAFAAFATIRATYPSATITALTTKPFAALLAASPWFDDIITDARPKLWNLPGIRHLRRQLRGFDLVYDLQTSGRSTNYYRLAGRPPWSGIAMADPLAHTNPQRIHLHTQDRLADQLAHAGIPTMQPPDLSWLRADIKKFNLPDHYIVLVPGAAPHRPAKRWPAANYAALATILPLPCVIIGSANETALGATIATHAPGALDLTGRTTLAELATILTHADSVIGNDTGPMHLAAALAAPSIVLFSAASNPALAAPRYPGGNTATIIRADDLAALPVQRVASAWHSGIETTPA